MSRISELLAEKARIEKELTEAKPLAVAEVREHMAALGVTVADLLPPVRAGAKRAVKYRDNSGNTWTGVGQRPRWLVQALARGETLESFRAAP